MTFYEVSLKAFHIPGPSNTVANAISRNNMVVFESQVPHVAASAPTVAPQTAIDLLIQHCPDWTSVAWSRLFKNSLHQEQQTQPEGCMYRTGESRYIRFCIQASLLDYPASERVLMMFVAHLRIHTAAGSWVNKELLSSSTACPNLQGFGRSRHSYDAPAGICDEGYQEIISPEHYVGLDSQLLPRHAKGPKASVAKSGQQGGSKVTCVL